MPLVPVESTHTLCVDPTKLNALAGEATTDGDEVQSVGSGGEQADAALVVGVWRSRK